VVPPQALARQQPGSWRSAVILGAVVAVVGGVVIANWDGEGDRSTGDRVRSGILGGLMVAVPVTVIFALLIGEDG
jgi:ABC-type amino acid transport system permease subunit